MPRQMPRFDLAFAAAAQTASEIVTAGEKSHAYGGALGDEWTPKRIEYLYEFAYLRVFATWEATLEAIFLRSLCGYASRVGPEVLIVGTYYRTIAAAEAAVLAGNQYMLWHNSAKIIARCQRHIRSGVAGCPALMETTIASNLAHLDELASIRHRIVHDQKDAKSNFDAAGLLPKS